MVSIVDNLENCKHVVVDNIRSGFRVNIDGIAVLRTESEEPLEAEGLGPDRWKPAAPKRAESERRRQRTASEQLGEDAVRRSHIEFEHAVKHREC